jgi:hypothetical protein
LNGFYPRYSLEDVQYIQDGHIAFPMVCFCDIPISRIQEHTAFYGSYGIGLTKDWGLKNELAPLIYTPSTSAVTEVAKWMLDFASSEQADKELRDAATDQFFRLIPMLKPIRGTMFVQGQRVDKEFYQENEWRYVPKRVEVLFQEQFEAERDAKNLAMISSKLAFLPPDVKYIFVGEDSEIPIVFDFIQNNLGQYPLNDIKILTSRIISLETVARDL